MDAWLRLAFGILLRTGPCLTLTKSQLFSYRLTTEQSSGFVKLVKGFAYAEEFTCSPPTVFMLAITALQGLNHTFGGIWVRRNSKIKSSWIYLIKSKMIYQYSTDLSNNEHDRKHNDTISTLLLTVTLSKFPMLCLSLYPICPFGQLPPFILPSYL